MGLVERRVPGRLITVVVVASALVAAAGCRGESRRGAGGAVARAVAARAWVAEVTADPAGEVEPCSPSERLPVFADGVVRERVCPADVAKRGLQVIDLSDEWLSSLFDEDLSLASGRLEYRAELLALQNERLDALPEGHRAKGDRYLELYGISPAISVVRARLLDDARHACHDRIDDASLDRLEGPLDVWRKVDAQRGERFQLDELARRLEQAREKQDLASFAALETDPQFRTSYKIWKMLDARVSAIAAAQAHLRCEGTLNDAEDRVIDTRTLTALQLYLRKHAVVTWTIDSEAAATMASDSRVLDFRALLRSLRERVVDATGLIEDGSALGAPGKVVDQDLDSHAFDHLAQREPLENGAPDLVSEATDAAARALGWRTASEAIAFFKAFPEPPKRVAIRLPDLPRYHSGHMELRAEIDRGDVWYDYPYAGGGSRTLPALAKRPVLTLYAKADAGEVALVRWGTTIGDWKPERVGRTVRMLYKESPSGKRLWRDLVVTPRWIPPESTPTRDLVVPVRGGYRVKRELVGPSYASAYGLVMLVHHLANGSTSADQGIRTHGSVSYDSIHQGSSHGCHRLHNHRAVRLGQFLRKHRRHVRHGAEPFPFGRAFAIANQRVALEFDSRGYRYELTPPIEIEVLRGRIMGKSERAIAAAFNLPADLARKFMAEMAQ